MRVEATTTCGALPVLLLALEELGLSYDLVARPEGWFVANDGMPGPAWSDGARRVVGMPACLAAVATPGSALLPDDPDAGARLAAVMRLWTTRALPAAAAVRQQQEGATQRLVEALEALSIALGSGPFFLGERLSLADLPAVRLAGADHVPDDLAALAARLTTRPAWVRARTRAASLAVDRVATPEEILAFWMPTRPATDAHELRTTTERWLAGVPRDEEVRRRFGATVEAALAGRLNAWAERPDSRLALVIVLDQLTRHVFRDRAEAFAGDGAAQALAERILDEGDADEPVEARIVARLPLAHAEDPRLQARSVEEAEALLRGAPPALRPVLAHLVDGARAYRATIARFGRFPHRNAAYRRASTREEEDFLAGEWRAMRDHPQHEPASDSAEVCSSA